MTTKALTDRKITSTAPQVGSGRPDLISEVVEVVDEVN